jgi:hypothetical protein
MTKLRGVVVGLVFLVGCAVGGATSHFAAPPASAQQTATRTRWEHLCFEDDSDAEDLATKADRAGAAGWELVGGAIQRYGMRQRTLWCFKRAKL